MSELIAGDGGHHLTTAGKETPFIKSLGRRIKEWEFNRPVINLLLAELKRCGFKTLDTAPEDYDVPLKTRTDRANKAKADLYISIHFNALDGKFDGPGKDPEGFSAHIYPGQKNQAAGKFAAIALKHLVEGTNQKNRGIVEQNLHITRETNMPAVLFELGFMDNEREASLMLNKDFQKECAVELAKAVCEYYKVAYVPEKQTSTINEKIKEVEKEMGKTLFQPSSNTFKSEMVTFLEDAHKRGILSSHSWIEKAKNGTLLLDDAIALVATIINRSK